MQLFEITKNQDAILVKTAKRIKDAISEAKTYLIVDNDSRTIWLYVGQQSGMALQFIGIKLQKEMKLQMRGFFATRLFTELEKESDEYNKVLSAEIKEGKAVEILHKEETVVEKELTETQKQIKQQIDESSDNEVCVHKGVVAKVALQELAKIDNQENFHRNMAIIGNSVYSEEITVEKFITEKKESLELKKVGNLPNGFFFLENVSTRLFIKRGAIQSIDIMVPNDQFLGINRVMVPILFKEKIHKEGNMNNVLNAFKKPEIKGVNTTEAAQSSSK